MVANAGAARLLHGGDLAAARRKFPNAPEPFVDLSTGINPHPYPLPQLPANLFVQLPQPDVLERLLATAAKFYGAPSPDCVVAAPGTQILLPAVAALKRGGRARVLGPTYAEHALALTLAGYSTSQVADVDELRDADLAVVVNPNNPDGRLLGSLLAIADELRRRDALLVVDEAFMDVAGDDCTLAGEVLRGNVVVLRSFGKFFGLAGLRLGFALAAPQLAARLARWLGPWAVSGPAMAVGQAALSDAAWVSAMRETLRRESQRLVDIVAAAELEPIGGTSLFHLVGTAAASELYEHLGRAGILVRRFTEQRAWLRFGLPGAEAAWVRLRSALDAFRRRRALGRHAGNW